MEEQASQPPPWAVELLARLERIEARLLRPASCDDVVTTAELAKILRLSEDAAREWAARWGVRPSERNRWPMHRIQAGLQREARTGGRRARRPGAAAAPRATVIAA